MLAAPVLDRVLYLPAIGGIPPSAEWGGSVTATVDVTKLRGGVLVAPIEIRAEAERRGLAFLQQADEKAPAAPAGRGQFRTGRRFLHQYAHSEILGSRRK